MRSGGEKRVKNILRNFRWHALAPVNDIQKWPLLCVYADFVGILGGAFIGITMLDLSFVTYMQQTADAVGLIDLVGGVFKAFVYGLLIAIAGCLRGLQSGTSSSGVGIATTSAVVTSIVFIISACGIFAVLFYVLGI